jgi:hypothetical protein
MSRAANRRQAPSNNTVTAAPATPPRALASHLITSDGGTRTSVELLLPVRPSPTAGPPLAYLRLDLSHVLGRQHGADGWESFEVPVEDLEDLVRNFGDVVALARELGMLP